MCVCVFMYALIILAKLRDFPNIHQWEFVKHVIHSMEYYPEPSKIPKSTYGNKETLFRLFC